MRFQVTMKLNFEKETKHGIQIITTTKLRERGELNYNSYKYKYIYIYSYLMSASYYYANVIVKVSLG